MNLAVIPARGGSKRIPRKNVKPFAGIPMIAHAIRAARQCRAIDRVVVSTDDEEIAQIARDHGAETPFTRPAELADDHTPTAPVVQHAIQSLDDEQPDYVCCIYPGVPFIEQADIAAALDLLREKGAGYTFPVAEFPAPIQRALKLGGGGEAAPIQPEHALTRTQDLEPAYFDAGQFYWGSRATWLKAGAIHSHAHCIVIPEWRVVDIDTPADWDRAERLYAALHTPGQS